MALCQLHRYRNMRKQKRKGRKEKRPRQEGGKGGRPEEYITPEHEGAKDMQEEIKQVLDRKEGRQDNATRNASRWNVREQTTCKER